MAVSGHVVRTAACHSLRDMAAELGVPVCVMYVQAPRLLVHLAANWRTIEECSGHEGMHVYTTLAAARSLGLVFFV